ncbi:lytic transglycosylase domain-containing protein [Candidimonas humi]|uniref:Transglycosylase SLT domain-containing protein n=1 Tax=Candidimonas humi TaxID=683355 RepID=A0ABV8P2S9_9BURK|nr:lytic transglycosylase domain-containing protein [Candidimonas humi]MBV6305557.1 lytic transglycosylase domain-containing protein [Candidimonas humi]
MLSRQSQRYQKTLNLSQAALRKLTRKSWWLVVSVGLAGCAGAKLPANTAAAATVQAETAADPAPAADLPYTPLQLQPAPGVQQAVLDARVAMQGRQWDQLATLMPAAQGDKLVGDYPTYWYLRQQLKDPNAAMPVAAIDQFLANSHDPYLVDQLKANWIVAAARKGDYAMVERIGPVKTGGAQVECARLQAKAVGGKPVSASEALGVFASGRECWSLLNLLVASNVLGWPQLEPMLRDALEINRTGDAQRLADQLFQPAEMASYHALMKNPRHWLARQSEPRSRAQTELVMLALGRLARSSDRDAAAAYIEQHWAHALPASDLQWVWGQFGLMAALDVDSSALRWYRRSGDARMTDNNHAWEVRTELRQARIDWGRVRKAIDKMSASQRAEPVWTYWYGRALAAQGDRAGAAARYQSIAAVLDFYGQLANEELGRPIAIPPAPPPVTAAELAQARADVGLRRGVRLFRLGWRPEAVAEWNFTLRGMSDRQLLAAAELARHEQIFDRVINTSLKTTHEIDFQQRFIAPFEGRVAAKARQINLDPAWVYGLIRQESRFITDARSAVGASGLMQLMPSTARWVAHKIGMDNFSPAVVNDFDTNTILGTNYLSMVLQKLDGSQLLATAGYNAGPRRPVQWRASLPGPVEGAIFAETIPFTETRLYVKHVMSNATYYATMFSGHPQSLKARLGVVSPEPNAKVGMP